MSISYLDLWCMFVQGVIILDCMVELTPIEWENTFPRVTLKGNLNAKMNIISVKALMKVLILLMNFNDIESIIFQVYFLKLPSPSFFLFRYFVNKQILLYLELAVTITIKNSKIYFHWKFTINESFFNSKLTRNI